MVQLYCVLKHLSEYGVYAPKLILNDICGMMNFALQ